MNETKTMHSNYENLDAQELYHLGIKASESGDHQGSIILLKRSLELNQDAKTQYILAAEHAEIGMFERAIEGMGKAVELDPTLWTAHFQCGLLHMMLQSPTEAIQSWATLDSLQDDDPLKIFGAGMTKLLQNELASAKDLIEKGIRYNKTNIALNRDMEAILKNIDAALENAENEEKSSGEKQTSHIFLSSYNKDNDLN